MSCMIAIAHKSPAGLAYLPLCVITMPECVHQFRTRTGIGLHHANLHPGGCDWSIGVIAPVILHSLLPRDEHEAAVALVVEDHTHVIIVHLSVHVQCPGVLHTRESVISHKQSWVRIQSLMHLCSLKRNYQFSTLISLVQPLCLTFALICHFGLTCLEPLRDTAMYLLKSVL